MLNIPNMLSIFRLCLVPLFVVLYFSGVSGAGIMSVAIYALATFTDFLDGYIARKYDLVTNLGKVLDPLGDKMMTFAVLACITIDGIIPVWVVIVFLIKELGMGLGGLLIHRKARVEIPPSNIVGKTATVLFFVVCAVLMLFPGIAKGWATVMICLALIVTLVAFVTYAMKYFSIMKKKDA